MLFAASAALTLTAVVGLIIFADLLVWVEQDLIPNEPTWWVRLLARMFV